MPSPAINTTVSQVARAEGTTQSCATCPSKDITWKQTVNMVKVTRPKSVSNPVRKDGSRAQGSWRHAAAFTRLGEGFYSYTDSRPTMGRDSLHGNVTTPRSNGTAVDHTLATRLLNDARMRALSQLTQSKSQFNVAAYEAKGTISTLNQFCRKAAQGVYNAAQGLKRRDPRLLIPPGSWKKFPGDYLGYLYGLKPLADDISNGLDQLSDLSKQGMAYGYWVRSGKSETLGFEETVSTPANLRPFYALGAQRRSFARVGYYYSFPEWWIENTPIVTPFSDAWELTRMSFVLDWALPLGSWIGAMEAAQFDPYFRAGFEVYGTEENIRGPFKASRSLNFVTEVMSNETYHNRRYEMVRTGLGPGSKPTGRVAFPSFRKFLGLDTAAQSLALLSQAFTTPPSSWRSPKRTS